MIKRKIEKKDTIFLLFILSERMRNRFFAVAATHSVSIRLPVDVNAHSELCRLVEYADYT